MSGGYADLIAACQQDGSEILAADFTEACHRLARTLTANPDDRLEDHIATLVKMGDRFAAALTVCPDHWGIDLRRSCTGVTRAAIELPDGRGLQPEVISNDEGAALLGAIAATLGASGAELAKAG